MRGGEEWVERIVSRTCHCKLRYPGSPINFNLFAPQGLGVEAMRTTTWILSTCLPGPWMVGESERMGQGLLVGPSLQIPSLDLLW